MKAGLTKKYRVSTISSLPSLGDYTGAITSIAEYPGIHENLFISESAVYR